MSWLEYWLNFLKFNEFYCTLLVWRLLFNQKSSGKKSKVLDLMVYFEKLLSVFDSKLPILFQNWQIWGIFLCINKKCSNTTKFVFFVCLKKNFIQCCFILIGLYWSYGLLKCKTLYVCSTIIFSYPEYEKKNYQSNR